MIEEALGLKVYQYKKVESLKKLDRTKENIEQVESLRREIAPHIRFLKKQVEKVEKAVAMKSELLEMAKGYFASEKIYIGVKKDEIRKTKEPLEKKLEEAREEVKRARETLANAENRDVKSEELMGIETHLREIRNKKDDLSRERGRVEGEIASSARMLKRQEEMMHSTEWKTVEMQAVETLRDDVLEYVHTIESSSDFAEIKKAVDAIRALFSAFVEMRKDTTDMGAITDIKKEIDRLSLDREKIESEISKFSDDEKKTEEAYSSLRRKIEQEKETDRDAEKKLFQSMSDEKVLISELHAVATEEEALRFVEEDFRRDVGEVSIMVGKSLLGDELSKTVFDTSVTRESQKELKVKIEKIKIRLEDSGGAGGDEVLKEYNDAIERDQFLEKELVDLRTSAESLTNLITELEEKISDEFTLGLIKINKQFQDFFVLMFGGGNAELTLIKTTKRKKNTGNEMDALSPVDDAEMTEEEDLDDGIDIDVSLPRKKTKGLIQLSGGERALTSIALLFAISQVNPPPFIILDETDAALDEANSKKYGDMIEILGKSSQLIVITHNRETMSRAGALFGVTMGSGGVSKLLTVAFEEAVAVAK
jgi:chromosome segregation protein